MKEDLNLLNNLKKHKIINLMRILKKKPMQIPLNKCKQLKKPD